MWRGIQKKAHQALIYALQTSDSLLLKNNVTKWGTIWKNNESSIRAVEILVLSFPYITNYCYFKRIPYPNLMISPEASLTAAFCTRHSLT